MPGSDGAKWEWAKHYLGAEARVAYHNPRSRESSKKMAQSQRVLLLWAVMATTALSVVECTCHEQGSDQGEQWGLHAGSAAREATFTVGRGGRAGKATSTDHDWASIHPLRCLYAHQPWCLPWSGGSMLYMRLHLCNRGTFGLVTYMYRTVALWRAT